MRIPGQGKPITDYEALAEDLLVRVKSSAKTLVESAVDTATTVSVTDVVEHVEDRLPPWYPRPSDPDATRAPLIIRAIIERTILSGEIYEEV